jgi:hypothetical protein
MERKDISRVNRKREDNSQDEFAQECIKLNKNGFFFEMLFDNFFLEIPESEMFSWFKNMSIKNPP